MRTMSWAVAVLVSALVIGLGRAPTAQPRTAPPIVGRWNLTVQSMRGPYASWLEVEQSGFQVLVGRFMGRIGHARPISRIDWRNDSLRFAIPPQWNSVDGDLRLEARLVDTVLQGTIIHPEGPRQSFVGYRAPSLRRTGRPSPGPWIELFNGRDLAGWVPDAAGSNRWVVRNGVLRNDAAGANLMTTAKYQDFELHAEFRYARGEDSGISLRGRYHLKLKDDTEREWPTDKSTGAIYGFLTPSANVLRGPGEWQTLDATLVGRRVTVVVNGRTVIANQLIPGLTNMSVDADERAPGSFVLQGEEGPFEYRNIRVRHLTSR